VPEQIDYKPIQSEHTAVRLIAIGNEKTSPDEIRSLNTAVHTLFSTLRTDTLIKEIDLIARTFDGDYWAVQCKCSKEDTIVDKPAVDSFLATSSREFKSDEGVKTRFAHRLWVATTNHWGANAAEAIHNQNPPVSRVRLTDLQQSPVNWVKLEKSVRHLKHTVRSVAGLPQVRFEKKKI